MKSKSLAHLSDLHLGLGPAVAAKAEALVAALVDQDVDHVVVTGDLTDSGRVDAYRQFQEIFAPLIIRGRITIVPGNHDRLGDDVGGTFMAGERVDTVSVPGAYFVRVDSTGPHNRSSVLAAHGRICQRVLEELSSALDRAPADALVAILLHHHPRPLPEESLLERLACFIGLPYAAELSLGEELLRQALGRADLVLHGHRHVPAVAVLNAEGERPLRVYNAGSSILRGGMNVFAHAGGVLCGEPRWLRPSDVMPVGAGSLDIPGRSAPSSRSTTRAFPSRGSRPAPLARDRAAEAGG